MAALGDFGLPRVEVAFHADVGWERERTVEMREFYSRWLAAFGIPVVVTEARNIRHDGAKAHVHVPFWTVSGAPLSRQCTREFKIRPVRRALRAWLGLPRVGGVPLPPATVEQWIGFSLDEARRCKSSGVASVVNRFPLVELGLTRTDCALYLQEKRLPVPVKSAWHRLSVPDRWGIPADARRSPWGVLRRLRLRRREPAQPAGALRLSQ